MQALRWNAWRDLWPDRRPGGDPAVEPGCGADNAPATASDLAPNEERYVLAEALTPATYVTPWAHLIEGPLDAERLRLALGKMAERHDVMRTCYHRHGPATWTRAVLPDARPLLKLLVRPGQSLAQLRAELEPWLFAPVDFTPATLCRFALVRIAPESHWFIFSMHHALSDGTSFNLFMEELFGIYDGEAPSSPAVAYRSLFPADWRSEPRYRSDFAWWNERLAGLEPPDGLPADLEGDDPRAVAAECEMPIPEPDAGMVAAAAAAMGVSPFTIWLAAALTVISRLQDDRQVVAAFQTSSRRSVPGSERAQGCFSNALVLSLAIDQGEPVAGLVRRVRAEMRAALQHENVPFHDVLQATGVHPTVGINWFPPMPPIACRSLEVHPAQNLGRSSDYQLNLRFIQSAQGLRLILYYRPGILSGQLAEAVTHRIIATGRLFADCPESPVGRIPSPYRTPPPAAAPPMAVPAEPVHARFLDMARSYPDRPALRYRGHPTSYAELEAASRTIAHRLRDAGATEGQTVAVLASRSPAAIKAILGVSRSGAAFTTIDTAYPEARWKAMADVVRPVAILWAGEDGTQAQAQALAAGSGVPFLDVHHLPPGGSGPPLPAVDPEAIAYLLFTSGTTGTPRCIATTHRPLVHFLAWQKARFELHADDRFTMLSGLSHDPLMRDLFAPLSMGAELLIPDQEMLTEPGGLLRWSKAEAPTVMHITPPLGRLLTDHSPAGVLPSLRLVFWGGDLLRPALVADLARMAPNARSVNFYGATETPQAIAWNDAASDATGGRPMRAVPVGVATPGFDLAIEQTDGTLAATGEVGEIVVRSQLLSRGYVENGEVRPHDPAGTYRTGDRAFRLPSGKIMLSGRRDDQVKVRGYRVELADIAAGLESDPRVRQAAAIAFDAPDDTRIEAFVTLDKAGSATGPDLQRTVASARPAHLVPHRIHVLERLPLLANGKLDRQALRTLARDADAADANDGAPTEAEAALMAAWSEILGRRVLSPQRSFAELGGDSLSFVQAFLVLERRLGDVPEGWQFQPIYVLAKTGHRARGWLQAVDTPVVIRAIAILMVLFLHFGVFDYGGGATAAMFLVTGFLLGGLQFAEFHQTGSAKPFFRLLGKLIPPVFIFGICFYIIKIIGGRSPDISIITMTADLVDYSKVAGGERTDYGLALWYVHAMIHLIFLFGIVLPLAMQFRIFRSNLFHLVAGLFILGLALKFALPAAVDPRFLAGDMPRGNIFTYLPSSHLATLALGALIATARTNRDRWMTAAGLMLFVGLSWWLVPRNSWQFLLGAGLLLILLPHLRMPRPTVPPLLAISSASLFIYLMHLLVTPFRWYFDLPKAPLLEVAAGLAMGLVAWWVWTRLLVWLQQRFRLQQDATTAAV